MTNLSDLFLAVSPADSIKQILDGFWTMDEAAAADRVDSHSDIDMIDMAGLSVSSATGVNIGTATSFDCLTSDAASPSSLQHTTNPDNHLGQGSFGAFCWVEPGILDTGSFIMGRTDNASNITDSWGLVIDSSDFPSMIVTATNIDYTATFGTVVDTSSTYFLASYYDFANDEVGISVNGSAYVTAAVTGKRDNDGDRFFMGRRGFTANKLYYMGLMNRAGITRAPLSIDQVSWLYNGGAGRSYLDIIT